MYTPQSGDFVRWADGEGKILSLVGTNAITKSADGALEARIRRIVNDQLTEETLMVPVAQLSLAPVQTARALEKGVTAETLDATLDALSDEERKLLAIAYFSQTQVPLPNLITGETGPRPVADGVSQGELTRAY